MVCNAFLFTFLANKIFFLSAKLSNCDSTACINGVPSLERISIKLANFFKPETSHLDYTVKNNQYCAEGDPHPNTEGHIQWANQLKDFIDDHNLCPR